MVAMPMPLPTRLLPRVLALPALLLCAAFPLHAEKKMPPALPAGQYPAHATQAGITIAADPYDRLPKEKVFRVDYLRYNFIPIRIIVTNDTDKPISLNDVRILLLPAENDERINASEPEDVERRVYGRARRGTNIPIGPITIHKQGKASDKKIDADFSELEYSALAVEPHTTRAGFLWYDVQGLGQNPLAGATLEFREVRNNAGKELFAFDVPMDAYLQGQK